MGVWSPSLEIGRSNDYPQGSTLQAIGNGNGLPLTGNAEGEEIVYSRLEREWITLKKIIKNNINIPM